MIPPGDALLRLLALKSPVPIETVPLSSAHGRWTADVVRALRTQPARALSAMDGYAVTAGDGPWHVVGSATAGTPFATRLAAGESVRIFTGAAVPEGADRILIQEDAERDGAMVHATGPAGPQGAHVRRAGSDFVRDDVLVEAGTLMTPMRVGLAALGGHASLDVRRRIRVALVSTGNELVAPGCDAGDDRLPASNAVMLGALLDPLPVALTDLGIIADDEAALRAAFAQAGDFDVMVSTGGASVGDHDLVHPALLAAGARIDFWKIAMRPGKPLMAGTLAGCAVLGLPGNPVSAFVTATLFLKPLIAHLSGAADPGPATTTAILRQPLPAAGMRTDYVRARWQDGGVDPLGGDSGMLVPLAAANALIVRAAHAPALDAGAPVTIIPLT